MPSIIREVWETIEAQLKQNAPSVVPTLNPPASDSEIAAVAATLSHPLPDDLTESLRIHNGQSDPTRLQLLTECGVLLSTTKMLEVWRMITEIHDDLKHAVPNRSGIEWWSRDYLPFTDFEGDHLCVNLAAGKHGEVLWHVHDGGIEHDVFPSYSDWLREVAAVFLTKRYAIDDGFIDFWPGTANETKS